MPIADLRLRPAEQIVRSFVADMRRGIEQPWEVDDAVPCICGARQEPDGPTALVRVHLDTCLWIEACDRADEQAQADKAFGWS